MRQYQIILYGSYGYTGQLIAEECKSKKLSVLLAGRDELKLKSQAEETGYEYELVSISDPIALVALLKKGTLLIHCGGPFRHTAQKMVEACLEASTHYTDITGEYEVFEMLASFGKQAIAKNIVIMPGTGFDVVPSDCLAVYLKNKLPDATHLQLAFSMSKGGLSRGTSKTMMEGLGQGSCIRKDGKLTVIKMGERTKHINFGAFSSTALCIPWGDIATAWRSTNIPNIEVYTAVSKKMIRTAKLGHYLGWLLRQAWVREYLQKNIDKKPAGPNKQKRDQGRSYLWGRVWNKEGTFVEVRLETPSGYSLTAKTSVLIAEKMLSGNVRTGYFTPAQYFGEGLILEIEGTRLDVPTLS
jgi:short subunit dehydrogenase-like uncharacterized protein